MSRTPRPSADRRRVDAPETWRSLEQRANDPKVREFIEREFPEGAAEPPRGISRRQALTLLGASLSLAGLAGCRRPEEEIVPFVRPPEGVTPGIPRRYATTMPFGQSAFGLVVHSHEGRPTKIEGNENHPSTLGSSNTLIQASILTLYDPDRSQRVLEAGQPTDWDAFVAAWSALEQTHLEDGGTNLAVLSEPFHSPTLARLAAAFRRRFPQARWVTYAPVNDENIDRGIALAAGRTAQPVYRFERARVVLSLDCDFMLGENESIRHSRGFADGRRMTSTGDSMNRLYVVEGVHSITGGNADHRLPMSSSRIAAFVAALAARLQSSGLDLGWSGAVAEPTPYDSRWLEAVADDLLANRGSGLVVAGRRQPAELHAAVLAINAALGNVGSTVEYHEPTDAERSDASTLPGLIQAIESDAVQTLIVLGGNPVYDAPADLELQAALGSVPNVIHLGHHVDETGTIARWHIPRAHYLEAWSDARAVDGTAGVVQPLIAPLYGGTSEVELLGLLVNSGSFTTDCGTGPSPRSCRCSPCRARSNPSLRLSREGGRAGWSSCSSNRRRFGTAASPTSVGCRSCPTR
jgi:molybdopterin-containing oxidoreductase family iron-sulfur binding subunit